jgi:hypothetical protein
MRNLFILYTNNAMSHAISEIPYKPASSIMQRYRVHLHHNVAAASTAPAALKAVSFVNRTSTGYIHFIYFAQPINQAG